MNIRPEEITSVLKKEIEEYIKRAELDDIQRQAKDALFASVAEFVLEGLHVENRLNKSRKSGEYLFRR